MQCTTVKVISDGVMKIDGGSMFGLVPKVAWENSVSTDRKNRISLGLNCLLLQASGHNVLVDTGVGRKEEDPEDESIANVGLSHGRLAKGLKEAGLTANDIDVVVLSHLHFDHSGGCTRWDRTGEFVATFPNATYFAQRASWEEACHPSDRCAGVHRPENFRPLERHGQLELLDGDTEVIPGLNVIVTGGHSSGHQMVLFNHGGERIAYLGDLIPTPYHLNPAVISAFDTSPETTLERKQEVLAEAENQDWLLVFPHGHEVKAGYLERRSEKVCLRPVDL